MDLLHTVASMPEGVSMLPAGLPLGESSGNLQSLVVGSRDGVENQTPCSKQDPQFPIPAVKLGSNDSPDHGIDKESKTDKPRTFRPKVLYDPKRPFLQHPKYLEYMGRQRQEFGKDGKPVWSDEVEAAFQDALTHIPPMGRKKYSQRSRLFGRNMLIAEWILQATGETRERKQVSSHIQVLDRFLKGIPEWDVLITPSRLALTACMNEGRKDYHNSIEHMVKQQKANKHRIRAHPLQRHRYSSNDDDNEWDTQSLAHLLDDVFHLRHMHFEMWVSFPDQPEHALHKYTSLQTATETSMSMPLEDVIDWRLSFPHLQNSIGESPTSTQAEIILLNASFQLMDNFPPRHSKLGIGLELEFCPDDKKSSISATQELKNWHSITFIYQNGDQVREPMCEKCIISSNGQVRPVFQSRWWASTFTSLTEIKKLAEDSRDPGMIEAASDRVHGFFQSLTIMQEIWATHNGAEGSNLGRRMSILLWKFSQAPAGFVGTTTWQKLIAPPLRLATNSPLPPPSEMGLPPLSIDAMIEGSPGHTTFDRNDHFLEVPSLPYGFYQTTIEDEICPDSFMSFKVDDSSEFAQVAGTFSNPAGAALSFDQLHDPSNHYHFGLQDSSGLEIHAQEDNTAEANLFEMPHLTEEGDIHSNTDYGMLDHLSRSPYSPTNSHGQPLARFNMKYHTVLQEQLGTDDLHDIHSHHQENGVSLGSENKHSHSPLIKSEPCKSQDIQDAMNVSPSHHEPWTHIDDHDEALRSALLAASAADDVHNSQPSNIPHSPSQHQSQYILSQQSQTPHWGPPLAFRPTLQSHHSFPGLDYRSATDEELILISHPQPVPCEERYLQSTFPGEERKFEANSQTTDVCVPTLTRPRSKPDLSSYQSTELDTAQPHHQTVASEPRNSESSSQDDALAPPQAPELFSGHGSPSQLQERSIVSHHTMPGFGEDIHLDKGYAEVKMEDIEI